MNTKSTQQRVVIYGGGMAGAILAKELAPDFQVTLVDPNDYFEVPMAAPRNLVIPSFADKAIIPFKQALPNVEIVHGKLVDLDNTGGLVTLNNGTQIRLSGDISVLATGSTFSNQLMRGIDSTALDRKAFYQSYSERINAAQNILIVGGGPIGIEVAGEISEVHPNKNITILEASSRVLGGTTAKAAEAAVSELTRRRVAIITGDRISDSGSSPDDVFSNSGVATTTSGRKIPYDLIIWCIGGKPNTDYMRSNLASTLNSKGQIKVTPQLRVIGNQHLFALGDITDLDENKMAWHITGQIKSAVFNIRKVLAGKDEDKFLKSHKPQTGNPMMAITLGSRMGVLNLPVIGVVTCPMMTRTAKAGHMLVPQYRKIMGV